MKGEKLLSRIKKIDYSKKLNPIYIESIEANQIYINKIAEKTRKPVTWKVGKDNWVEFKKISTRKAVLNDSLFLRFMKRSIVRDSGDSCRDFIVVKFNYNAEYRTDDVEEKVDYHDLRTKFYKDGVTYIFEKRNKFGEVVEKKPIHYKMLMRSTGKAKDGECVFIRDDLHHKAINFLTMGLYDLMDEQSKNDPEKVFKLVEMSAYQTLTTATAIGYIQIPLENILIIKDVDVYTDPMHANIVKDVERTYTKDNGFQVDFDSPRTESIINKKGFTFDENKLKEHSLTLIEKTKEALKSNGIRVNGKYPGEHIYSDETRLECETERVSDAMIKNVIWDGMGLIDESIFPENMNGFIYCRSHFFKSCLFRGNIQDFFKDYCNEHDIDYNTYTVESVDMFKRPIRLLDIKVIITDKSIKWIKFVDMMGGTEKKAYKFYRKYMKDYENYFSIVKTAHKSKWNDLQLSAYQMNNSVPCTNMNILKNISKCGVDFCNQLKQDDLAYLKYLNNQKNNFNTNEVLLELVKWNLDFMKTEFFRKRKSRDISNLKNDFCMGRLPQNADNLTIMDNPIALLLMTFQKEPTEEGCFEVVSDGVQCYTSRFSEGERLAAFRNPHNSPNNVVHLYNVYPDKLLKYFPNIGQNVIVFNAIKTDTQSRLSGHDCDSDSVYVTNQKDLANLARKSYIEYPTIINEIRESEENNYHFTPEDYARMDNSIADAQQSIGISTDIAQLALSYYYDNNMQDKELEKCFVILSVIAQISIDLAKRTYVIDIVNEIKRLSHLPCMKRNDIPAFFAANKKKRINKEFDESKVVKSMNCPMDIIADIINNNVIKYSSREDHVALREFLNKDIKGSPNRYKTGKIVSEAAEYNKTIKYIEKNKNKYNDDVILSLKTRAMSQFMNKTNSELDQETVMRLVIFATDDSNKDVCATILNFLFRNHKDKFLNCFVKSVPKTNENFGNNT